MHGLIAYTLRALELPPGETVRRARDLAITRWTAWQQRVRSITGPHPLDDDVFARSLGLANGQGRDAIAERMFASAASVLPVRWPAQPRVGEPQRIRAAAAEAIAHRFDLLGSGPTRVVLNGEAADVQRRRMDALYPGIAAGYDPIDWHIDFKSGHRWPREQWFAGIRYGDRRGVDVKVPWELSRFQHAGTLGLAYRLDPGGAAGRRAAVEFRAQVIDWIAANPVRYGVNWACPMDVALRATSWLTGMALFGDAPEMTPAFRWLVAKSLYSHGRHIEANLEYFRDHTGNHYLSDVVGLLCIGAALPELPESTRWCLYGIQELTSEMERQVLPDGVDIEGSTAYHHLVAELFLVGTLTAMRLPADRRAQLARTRPGPIQHATAPRLLRRWRKYFDLDRPEVFPEWYLRRLRAMAEFAAAITKPDGRIPQIGDNDNGRVYRLSPAAAAPGGESGDDDPCDRRSVLAVAGRLFGDAWLMARAPEYGLDADLLVADAPVAAVRDAAARARAGAPPDAARVFSASDSELRLYEQGGLAVVRAGPLYMAISFGCVSPASSGGHFHNDLLSFELQWDGVDFVVDGGSCLYTPAPALRDKFRSTIAHSTICVGGIEQRTWPHGPGRLFAVQHDASVRVLHAAADSLAVEAAYDDVRHVRRWSWGADWLRIEDEIDAPARTTFVLNIDPLVTLSPPELAKGERLTVMLERAGRRAAVTVDGVRAPNVANGFYSLGYGLCGPTPQVRAGLLRGRALAQFAFTQAAGAAARRPEEREEPRT